MKNPIISAEDLGECMHGSTYLDYPNSALKCDDCGELFYIDKTIHMTRVCLTTLSTPLQSSVYDEIPHIGEKYRYTRTELCKTSLVLSNVVMNESRQQKLYEVVKKYNLCVDVMGLHILNNKIVYERVLDALSFKPIKVDLDKANTIEFIGRDLLINDILKTYQSTKESDFNLIRPDMDALSIRLVNE